MMNVFQYAAITEKNWEMNLNDMSPYTPKYTFYSDFSIAEYCEIYKADRGAIKDTFKRVIESWGESINAMSEVALVLNHKSWAFYDDVDSKWLGCNETNRQKLIELYSVLYHKVCDYIYKKFGSDDKAMSYYYSVVD